MTTHAGRIVIEQIENIVKGENPNPFTFLAIVSYPNDITIDLNIKISIFFLSRGVLIKPIRFSFRTVLICSFAYLRNSASTFGSTVLLLNLAIRSKQAIASSVLPLLRSHWALSGTRMAKESTLRCGSEIATRNHFHVRNPTANHGTTTQEIQ
uniref:Uncharacterized protein n=1 Tax=Photinus pyralis TaxID=7054 RepID=A0A1Y1JXR4_PHOPY